MRLSLVLFGALFLAVTGCTATPEPVVVPAGPPVAVAWGEDGVALVGKDWIERLEGLSAPYGLPGAQVDAARIAVQVTDRVAMLRAHEPPVFAECVGCAGIAANGEYVVTTRVSYSPTNGFEFLLFPHDLSAPRVVAAERVEERAATTYPAENIQAPVTLAVGSDRIIVAYLSREGSYRRGPSIIAQYAFDGRLLDHIRVDAVLYGSAVSSDGRRLAIGVGGNSGYCHTTSTPIVVDLESLRVSRIAPAMPPATTETGRNPWFTQVDLVWRDGNLIATGEVHDPPPMEVCDEQPELWRREFDPAARTVKENGNRRTSAVRWFGPGCQDVVAVTRDGLVRGEGQRLGAYTGLVGGQAAPADCEQT